MAVASIVVNYRLGQSPFKSIVQRVFNCNVFFFIESVFYLHLVNNFLPGEIWHLTFTGTDKDNLSDRTTSYK